jgi:hypothetical protein
MQNARHYFETTGILDIVPESPALTSFFSNFTSAYRFCYIQFCGIVAASVDVERLWSQAGNIVTDQRNRLMDAKFAAELFVKFNKDVPLIQANGPFQQMQLDLSKLFENNVLPPVEPTFPIQVEQEIENESVDEEWSDEEMRGLAQEVEEEFAMANVDPYWSNSDATKHFGNSIKELLKQGSDQQMVTRNRKGILISDFL